MTTIHIEPAQKADEILPLIRSAIDSEIAKLDLALKIAMKHLDQMGNNVDKLMYTYHYQDENNRLVFRYDNARHKPPLSSPEHKYLPDKIVEAPAPTFNDVLTEIVAVKGWVQ